jgi:transposase
MKRSRFREEQIIAILKEPEAGMATADMCRRHGVSSATFYKWKSKYGGWESPRRGVCGRSRRRTPGQRMLLFAGIGIPPVEVSLRTTRPCTLTCNGSFPSA